MNFNIAIPTQAPVLPAFLGLPAETPAKPFSELLDDDFTPVAAEPIKAFAPPASPMPADENAIVVKAQTLANLGALAIGEMVAADKPVDRPIEAAPIEVRLPDQRRTDLVRATLIVARPKPTETKSERTPTTDEQKDGETRVSEEAPAAMPATIANPCVLPTVPTDRAPCETIAEATARNDVDRAPVKGRVSQPIGSSADTTGDEPLPFPAPSAPALNNSLKISMRERAPFDMPVKADPEALADAPSASTEQTGRLVKGALTFDQAPALASRLANEPAMRASVEPSEPVTMKKFMANWVRNGAAGLETQEAPTASASVLPITGSGLHAITHGLAFADVTRATGLMTQPIVVAASTSIDPVIERQVDLASGEQWLGEIATDIAAAADRDGSLSFRLNPQQLGRLDIDLSHGKSGLSLTIHAQTEDAQAILSAAQPKLVEEIRSQGIKVADAQMSSSDARGHDRQGPALAMVRQIEASAIDLHEPAAPIRTPKRDGRYA